MKTNGLETAWLDLYFTNVTTGFANVGDVTGLRGSTTAGSLYLSLHTAYPGEAGTQSTSEATYTSYARKAVSRGIAEWTVTGNSVTTDNANSFPACTGGTNDIYFVGIGRQSSGANELDYIVPLGTEMGEGTAATTDTLTLPGHTFSVSDKVCFFALPKVALPTGISAGTVYYIKTSATDTFTISATDGGATLDITAVGSFMAWKMTPLTVSNGITPQIAAGAITVKEE